jgi:hypothetical protein
MDRDQPAGTDPFTNVFSADPTTGRIDRPQSGFTQDDMWRSLRMVMGGVYLEPPDITARYGITFTRDFDDLDYFFVSVVRTATGRLIGLRRYRGATPGTTEVCISSSDSADEARAELQRMLNLPPDVLVWIDPPYPS